MATLRKAAAYARFSSDMQREESIDAQLRAINEYASRNNLEITAEYIDRAHTATNDQRPDFQRMITDAKNGEFEVVVVHKLDRFARDRYISTIYRHELRLANVELRSVTENFDGSPESILLESMIEGWNEFYSKNLAREVRKGLKENALKGIHTGGRPPLGYDLDPASKKLVTNEFEAEAVRTIFQMYLKGEGYASIISALNARGYTTKRGKPFGKNSLHEILKNEKYTGTYVYNRAVAKDARNKYNRHRYKDNSEIIRVEGALPAIITAESFRQVQQKMSTRRFKAARYTAKHDYLLSGKLVCGVCGQAYVGNSRKPRPDHPLYLSYRCGKRNGSNGCKNSEIRCQELDAIVLEQLANKLFDPLCIPELVKAYQTFLDGQDTSGKQRIAVLDKEMSALQKGIDNIVNAVIQNGSIALSAKLTELEERLALLKREYRELKRAEETHAINFDLVAKAFMQAKEMLLSGSLESRKLIIEQYVEAVTIYPEHIDVQLRVSESFTVTHTTTKK